MSVTLSRVSAASAPYVILSGAREARAVEGSGTTTTEPMPREPDPSTSLATLASLRMTHS